MGIIENGILKYVHPTFLYEAICTLIIFIIIYSIRNKRKFKGEITYIYLMLYALARFFIENLRTDSLMFYNMRISAILSLVIFVAIFVILSQKYIKKIKKDKKAIL